MNEEKDLRPTGEKDNYEPLQGKNLGHLPIEILEQINREDLRRQNWDKSVRDLRKELEQEE